MARDVKGQYSPEIVETCCEDYQLTSNSRRKA
jgi:hypothetical protein